MTIIHYSCILSVIIIFFGLLGNREEWHIKLVFYSVSWLPVIGWIAAGISIFEIIERVKISKGNCTFGHKFRQVYKKGIIKNPIRAAVGGWDRYKCTVCPAEKAVKW